jgi:hypothetical protein
MPNSAVLIAPEQLTLEHIYNIVSERWPQNSSYIPGERSQVHVQVTENGTWYVTFNELTPRETVRGDYEDNDDVPETIRSQLGQKRFYMISFNNYRFCSAVVRQVLSRLQSETHSMWLDNDYAVLIPANVVLSELAENPDWDWRSYR